MSKKPTTLYMSLLPVVILVALILGAGYLLIAGDVKIPFINTNNRIEVQRVKGYPSTVETAEVLDKQRVIIKSQAELDAFLKGIDKTGALVVTTPIDFDKDFVVGVSSKTFKETGHSVKVKRIYQDKKDGSILVSIEQVDPADACLATMEAKTNVIVDLITLKQTDQKIDFELTKEMMKIANSNDSKTANEATREGYGKGVVIAGENDPNVVVLTADLSESTKSDSFAKKFPNRFIEVGVAEQNMAGIAAGLALSGKVPFIASYGVFSPGRNWDQIRVSICYSKANVKIVSSHTGFSAGPDGATHQALEDIALTRVLPNMVVLSPCDAIEAKKATIAAAKHIGPVYIRLAREKTSILTTNETSFEIGKAHVIKEGADLTIISHGPILNEVLKAIEEIDASCEIINCPSIKPLDTQTILASAQKTKKILVVEEHQIYGGLGSAICELIAEYNPIKVKIMGAKDTFGEAGTYLELLEKYGLSATHIKKEISNLLKS